MQPAMTSSANYRLTAPLAAALGIVFLILAGVSYAALNAYFVARAAETTPQQASFFATGIDDALSRLRHLPYVLASEQVTLDALRDGETEVLNARLAEIADRSGAEFVYVLNINGLTIASSNHADPDSLVGNAYTFRPYFLDALNGAEGQYYAVGVTTGRPGYFLSYPVRDADGVIFGVVTTKIGFAELSRSLADSGALVLVSDSHGVVITSSEPSLIYGHFDPLSAIDRQELEEQRQFGSEELFPLDWEAVSDSRAALNGVQYIWTRADLANEDWTLHLLSDLGDLRRQTLLYVAIGALSVLALIVAAMVYRATQLRRALAISNADRTRLVAEIDERERAERRLSEARAALAHKTQLETLGRLSVSITHELGQPISAMRNYLVAEEIAEGAAPGTGWPQLSGLVDRMQRLLDQLRHFGRNSADVKIERFAVQPVLEGALRLVSHSAKDVGVEVQTVLSDGKAYLQGDPNKFEQVLVNLVRNAIDAAAQSVGAKAVEISLTDTDEALVLEVSDTGPGLGCQTIDQLREPFFSTKPSGKGMGLGLAISGQIVDEMGGTLSARNGPGGGACFTLRFAKTNLTDA